ncbi:globin [Paenibacillus septentrionalis]|uniref:Globin n=1 Tax=Paenibacillus septentrionalis TaxID=429342 RepID=A0ABW1UZ99_9BACL
MSQQSTYEQIGGADTVRKIVEAFYPKVQKNPVIGPLFPEDIMPVMEKQYLFLTQFFGGPMLYTEQYGHPMMRARHMPFPITESSAQAWLSCMKEALSEINMSEPLQALVLERLSGPAYHFINTAEQE